MMEMYLYDIPLIQMVQCMELKVLQVQMEEYLERWLIVKELDNGVIKNIPGDMI